MLKALKSDILNQPWSLKIEIQVYLYDPDTLHPIKLSLGAK